MKYSTLISPNQELGNSLSLIRVQVQPGLTWCIWCTMMPPVPPTPARPPAPPASSQKGHQRSHQVHHGPYFCSALLRLHCSKSSQISIFIETETRISEEGNMCKAQGCQEVELGRHTLFSLHFPQHLHRTKPKAPPLQMRGDLKFIVPILAMVGKQDAAG